MTDTNTTAKPGVLAELDALIERNRLSMRGDSERALIDIRATVERLAEALEAAVTRLDSIGLRASCAPHDDKEKASEAFTTIMRSAYAMRDDLREHLAAFRGDA